MRNVKRMWLGRGRSIAASMSVVMLAMMTALTAVGCSVPASFSEAAGPLAEVVGGEYREYALGADPPDTRGAERAEAFMEAVRSGDAAGSLALWEDDAEQFIPGVKNAYTGYLDLDPSLATPDGRRVYGIAQRSVGALDYILRMHRRGGP